MPQVDDMQLLICQKIILFSPIRKDQSSVQVNVYLKQTEKHIHAFVPELYLLSHYLSKEILFFF